MLKIKIIESEEPSGINNFIERFSNNHNIIDINNETSILSFSNYDGCSRPIKYSITKYTVTIKYDDPVEKVEE